SLAPTRLLPVLLNEMAGCLPASRKSLPRRWSSRWGSPVHSLWASSAASTDSRAGSSGSNSSEPCTSLTCPRTQDTIMWRARNSAAVCPGSKTQVVMTNLLRPDDPDRRASPRGPDGACLDQLAAGRQQERLGGLGEERQPLVARQVAVAGPQEPARRVDDQRRRLPPQQAEELPRLDPHD